VGGFAEVYEVATAGGIPCAIRISLDPVDQDNPAVQKELENLEMLKRLTGHPRLVSLLDYWVVGGYLVTRWELAPEGNLLDVLARYQREGKPGIPQNELLRYMRDVAEAIDFLNTQGIYHRDIKPANLLVFFNEVKVGDLGLAKFVGASTASHTGGGTFGYLPPEAQLGRLSPTVDLYALAGTYVKLRTGREPFGNNSQEIFDRQRAGDPILDGLDPAEAAVVRQALAADPAARPQQGAREWVKKLSEALRQKSAIPQVAQNTPQTPSPEEDGKEDRDDFPYWTIILVLWAFGLEVSISFYHICGRFGDGASS